MEKRKETPQAKYDRLHTKSITFKLNTTLDADIFDRLAIVGNKQGYIKRLIRQDIQRGVPTND